MGISEWRITRAVGISLLIWNLCSHPRPVIAKIITFMTVKKVNNKKVIQHG